MPFLFYFPMIIWVGLMGVGPAALQPINVKARR